MRFGLAWVEREDGSILVGPAVSGPLAEPNSNCDEST